MSQRLTLNATELHLIYEKQTRQAGSSIGAGTAGEATPNIKVAPKVAGQVPATARGAVTE